MELPPTLTKRARLTVPSGASLAVLGPTALGWYFAFSVGHDYFASGSGLVLFVALALICGATMIVLTPTRPPAILLAIVATTAMLVFGFAMEQTTGPIPCQGSLNSCGSK